ncbi:MAG: hypothetical protein EHM79_02105 [Geobacter sp.]|nr:MAG: hypothetical protein EHM79_02105 [Geobacter sp.]
MKIDFSATKQKMIDAGLNLTRWAKGRGHAAPTVLRILSGTYPCETGYAFKAIVKDLNESGYLVFKDEDKAA